MDELLAYARLTVNFSGLHAASVWQVVINDKISPSIEKIVIYIWELLVHNGAVFSVDYHLLSNARYKAILFSLLNSILDPSRMYHEQIDVG